METRRARCVIGLVAALTIGGCASAPSASRNGPIVVMDYPSRSIAESTARRSLLKADAEVREEIEKALGEAQTASYIYSRALGHVPLETLPSATQRPSPEEVEAPRTTNLADLQKWWILFGNQIDRYDAFLREYPENWYVRHRFAWFLADLNLSFFAAEEWEKVIEQEPRFPYAYNNLATLYNHMGRDKESIVLLRKAIELKNDDPVFWTNLAVNYSTHRAEAMELYGWDPPRTFRECLNAYRRARKLDPKNVEIARDVATQFVLAKYFEVTDTADEALKEWDYYLGLDLSKDQRLFGCLNVGRIYLREKNDPEMAISWLAKALALDENNPAARAVMKSAQKALAERDAAPEEKDAE